MLVVHVPESTVNQLGGGEGGGGGSGGEGGGGGGDGGGEVHSVRHMATVDQQLVPWLGSVAAQ